MSARIDALYLSSPVWAQNAMVAGYGWWWRRRRFGPEFQALVAGLRQRERWRRDQFHSYQTERLAEVLRAARKSRHYGPLLAGMDGAAESPWDVLRRLPMLSKEQLRSRATDLLTDAPPKDVLVFRSSGTTGTPTEIYYTRTFHALETAIIEARNLNWGHATYTDRRVMFGARVSLVDEETDEKASYQIVGPEEAEIQNGLLSIQSPLAKAILGKEAGESVEVTTPRGLRYFEILEVRYD